MILLAYALIMLKDMEKPIMMQSMRFSIKNTFLLIQETWLSDVEFIRQFKLHFPGTECISTNKMDTGEIRAGRPYSLEPSLCPVGK